MRYLACWHAQLTRRKVLRISTLDGTLAFFKSSPLLLSAAICAGRGRSAASVSRRVARRCACRTALPKVTGSRSGGGGGAVAPVATRCACRAALARLAIPRPAAPERLAHPKGDTRPVPQSELTNNRRTARRTPRADRPLPRQNTKEVEVYECDGCSCARCVDEEGIGEETRPRPSVRHLRACTEHALGTCMHRACIGHVRTCVADVLLGTQSESEGQSEPDTVRHSQSE